LTDSIRHHATVCVAAGLCALPAFRRGDQKRPSVAAWKLYQTRLPSPDELGEWFNSDDSMCLICGQVSGNLEMIDFDLAGVAFDEWRETVEAMQPGLVSRLTIETTPSGGRHVVYRCESEVCGNVKLATRYFEADGPGEVTVGDRGYAARRVGDGWAAAVTMIETRGEGGLFLCAPSPGYELVQGTLDNLSVITTEEREILLGAAWVMDETPRDVVGGDVGSDSPGGAAGGVRPGDDFNARGDVQSILTRHGWRMVRNGENQHWCRPGKMHGTSATLKGGVFYVFTSNAPPFEPQKGYAPFAVRTMLEFGGDFKASARALAAEGFGTKPKPVGGVDLSGFRMSGPGVDLSGFVVGGDETIEKPASPIPVADLVSGYPAMRAPIIHGLLREGETMNVIAAPKTGKSWLSLDLAIAVATGADWLGAYKTVPGDVLIIDNELHRETSAHRVPMVAEARGVEMRAIGERIYIDNLRGRLQDINTLGAYFGSIEPGRFKVIVLDAFYRFMPAGGDENDNGTMANIYNAIDAFADRLQCAFVMIHHSSKGSQAGKGVTDVGAGAGAQSRATDTHLVLRPHEEDGAVVLDAAVRSWPPIEPVCLRWEFPVWDADRTLDPAALKTDRKPRRERAEKAASETEPKPEKWTPERFMAAFFGPESGVPEGEPVRLKDILTRAYMMDDLSEKRARMLVEFLAESGQLERVEVAGSGRPKAFRMTNKEQTNVA